MSLKENIKISIKMARVSRLPFLVTMDFATYNQPYIVPTALALILMNLYAELIFYIIEINI